MALCPVLNDFKKKSLRIVLRTCLSPAILLWSPAFANIRPGFFTFRQLPVIVSPQFRALVINVFAWTPAPVRVRHSRAIRPLEPACRIFVKPGPDLVVANFCRSEASQSGVVGLVVHRDEMRTVPVATVLCFVPAHVACEGAHAVVLAPVVVQIVPVL